MKRTQNVLNDGKRESRLPEPITRTQTVERRRRRAQSRAEHWALAGCVPYRKPALDLAHPAWFFVRKKKKKYVHKSPKRKKRKEESTEPPASAPYRKSKGEGEKSAQPEGIFV